MSLFLISGIVRYAGSDRTRGRRTTYLLYEYIISTLYVELQEIRLQRHKERDINQRESVVTRAPSIREHLYQL